MGNSLRIGWHVLYVKSRHERKVYNSLLELSLKSFLPLIKVKKKWSDRIKIIEKPLFPSYIFVYIEKNNDLHEALNIDGACMFLRTGKEYSTVTSKDIDDIKRLISFDDIVDFSSNADMPREGAMLKIKDGPLSGISCKVINIANTNKIIVSIDSMKQHVSVTLPANYLHKAPVSA